MKANIIRRAEHSIEPRARGLKPVTARQRAVTQIGDVRFYSDFPKDGAEAARINRAMEELGNGLGGQSGQGKP